MKTQHDHYDRLSVRLSVIISRLLAGQSLELKALANEFGVSERTLQRDFQQRLIHLDLEHSSGSYRLIRRAGREHLPNTFAFILNSGISGIIPAQNRRLIRLITSSSEGGDEDHIHQLIVHQVGIGSRKIVHDDCPSVFEWVKDRSRRTNVLI